MTARAPLGELVTAVGGGTPDRSVARYWGGDVPWASVKDLTSLDLTGTTEHVTDVGVADSATTIVPPDSVIIATRMAVGRVAMNGVAIAINQDLKALLCRDRLHPRYLLHFLAARAPQLSLIAKGATVKGITLGELLRLDVPLPSIEDQRRIATNLDRVMTLERAQENMLQRIDDLLRSAFVEAFGDPSESRSMWPIVRAERVIREIEAGTSVRGESRAPGAEEWSVLKVSAVTSGWYLPSECKVVSVVPPAAVVPAPGDLLFSRANTRGLVAATCLVDQHAPVFLPDKLWRLKLDQEAVAPEYLRYLLGDPGLRRRLAATATGTSGSMLNVSQSKLLRFAIPLPPLAEQRAFARFVRRVFKLRNRLKYALSICRALSGSLTATAFR